MKMLAVKMPTVNMPTLKMQALKITTWDGAHRGARTHGDANRKHANPEGCQRGNANRIAHP